MSRDDIAIALEKAAEALAEAAFAIRASDSPAGVAPPSRPAPEPPADISVIDQGECPAHHKAWIPSKNPEWQPYCPAKADDPAWSNKNGYCRITPKTAPDWLRVHGVAA